MSYEENIVRIDTGSDDIFVRHVTGMALSSAIEVVQKEMNKVMISEPGEAKKLLKLLAELLSTYEDINTTNDGKYGKPRR